MARVARKTEIVPLTGLRGVAILFVVIGHYYVFCAPYNVVTMPVQVQRALGPLAESGVTLFFTLSGFVIAYNYFDFGWRLTPAKSLFEFLFLRISRLYPR